MPTTGPSHHNSRTYVTQLRELDPMARVGLRKDLRDRRRARTKWLTQAMEHAGHTMTTLAAASGTDLSYISRIISAHRTPSLNVTVLLARALGVPLQELADVLIG